jgi:4'-phosphopantetheinyl transferase
LQLNWPIPSEFPKLSAVEIQLWAVALDPPAVSLEELLDVLSPDERARAEGYVVDKPRDDFVISRFALRDILGRYLDEAPGDLEIVQNQHGKPRLVGGNLHFNLAHSGRLALIAVTLDCEIGVDLEMLREVDRGQEIATRNFHRNELATIRAATANEGHSVFLRCWTRKEAVLKSLGVGLGYPLDAFDTLARRESDYITVPGLASLPAARCWLHDAEPAGGYLAAVATLASRQPPLGFTYSL